MNTSKVETSQKKPCFGTEFTLHNRYIRLAQTDRSAPVLYRYTARPVTCHPSIYRIPECVLVRRPEIESLLLLSYRRQAEPTPHSRFPVCALQLASQLASPTVIFIKLSWYICHPVLLARQGFGVSHLSSAHPPFIAASSPRCHSPATTHSHSGPWPPRTGA